MNVASLHHLVTGDPDAIQSNMHTYYLQLFLPQIQHVPGTGTSTLDGYGTFIIDIDIQVHCTKVGYAQTKLVGQVENAPKRSASESAKSR